MIDYEKMSEGLAENVRAVVAESGYCSVGEFCRAKGLSRSVVTRIASKKCVPTLKSLIEIANAADVPLTKLLPAEAF